MKEAGLTWEKKLYNIICTILLMKTCDTFLIINTKQTRLRYWKRYTGNLWQTGILRLFACFLSENRGHYMIENIIEDGLNDFFFTHLCKYKETWKFPVNFVGSVAFGFRDVLKDLCNSYEFELGKILKEPMSGLIEYHS